MSLGTCGAMRNDLVAARQFYKQALGVEPRFVPALVGLGSTYYADYDYTNAVASYKAALALDEICPGAHYGLAIAYACWGHPTQARMHLDRYRTLVQIRRKLLLLRTRLGGRSPNQKLYRMRLRRIGELTVNPGTAHFPQKRPFWPFLARPALQSGFRQIPAEDRQSQPAGSI